MRMAAGLDTPYLPAVPAAAPARRIDFNRSISGFVMYSGAVIVAWLLFRERVEPRWMLSWLVPTAAFMAFWLGFIVMTLVREPVEPEVSQYWEPTSRLIMHGTTTIVIASIWLFLPRADDHLRLIMLIFYTMFIPVTIMTATQASQVDRFANWGPCLSVAAVALLSREPDRFAYAGFALGYAVLMTSLGAHVRRAFRDRAEAQREIERVSVGLAAALQQVIAERETRARFFAAASHDLEQPLQAARLSWEQILHLQSALADGAPARRMEWAFESMEALVRQITDHLRLEAGVGAATCGRTPLGPILARVISLHEPAARLAGVDLRTLPTALVAVCDPALVERTLGNFIANALRHARARRVLVAARRRGLAVRLWVVDDGAGLSEVDPEALFADFVQGDHGDEIRGGYGLGLASARRMAGMMAGEVGVRTRPGRGSGFYLDLPRAVEGSPR